MEQSNPELVEDTNVSDPIMDQISEALFSLNEAKENYVRSVWASTGLSFEDFRANYMVEEEPFAFDPDDKEDFKVSLTDDSVIFRIHQKFRVRLMTDEEKEDFSNAG